MKVSYTTSEISELLGVTVAAVNNWINAGKLKSFKTPGGHNRITQENLIEFLHDNNIPVPSEVSNENKPKILVIEDDLDVREFILTVLQQNQYDIKTDYATDGFSAGSKLSKFQPDIVILDIMLPGIDGFEVCRQIRKEFGSSVKVLAVTGYFSDENKKKILEAGADEFMRKPMQLDELENVINKFILSFGNKYSLNKRNEMKDLKKE